MKDIKEKMIDFMKYVPHKTGYVLLGSKGDVNWLIYDKGEDRIFTVKKPYVFTGLLSSTISLLVGICALLLILNSAIVIKAGRLLFPITFVMVLLLSYFGFAFIFRYVDKAHKNLIEGKTKWDVGVTAGLRFKNAGFSFLACVFILMVFATFSLLFYGGGVPLFLYAASCVFAVYFAYVCFGLKAFTLGRIAIRKWNNLPIIQGDELDADDHSLFGEFRRSAERVTHIKETYRKK